MNARLRSCPLTVAKLPVATSRVPPGETASFLTLVSWAGSTTPAMVRLMERQEQGWTYIKP